MLVTGVPPSGGSISQLIVVEAPPLESWAPIPARVVLAGRVVVYGRATPLCWLSEPSFWIETDPAVPLPVILSVIWGGAVVVVVGGRKGCAGRCRRGWRGCRGGARRERGASSVRLGRRITLRSVDCARGGARPTSRQGKTSSQHHRGHPNSHRRHPTFTVTPPLNAESWSTSCLIESDVESWNGTTALTVMPGLIAEKAAESLPGR